MVAVIPATPYIPPILRIMHLMLAANRAGTLDVIVVAAETAVEEMGAAVATNL